MANYVGLTGNTVHMAANVHSARWACRSRTVLNGFVAGTTQTEKPVTCGNCLRIVTRAWDLAAAMVEAMTGDERHAERHVAFDVETDGIHRWQSAADLRRVLAMRRDQVAYWFNRGDVTAVATAAYSVRRGELELAHLEELAAEAELEAYEWERRLERVAQGRAEAAQGKVDGQRTPYPVDDADWLRSALSLTSVLERWVGHHVEVMRLIEEPGELDPMDLWELGRHAFDRQRNLDIVHARVIGECPGCWKDVLTGVWGHRTACPMYLRSGDGQFEVTEPWPADEIRKFWDDAVTPPSSSGQHVHP